MEKRACSTLYIYYFIHHSEFIMQLCSLIVKGTTTQFIKRELEEAEQLPKLKFGCKHYKYYNTIKVFTLALGKTAIMFFCSRH